MLREATGMMASLLGVWLEKSVMVSVLLSAIALLCVTLSLRCQLTHVGCALTLCLFSMAAQSKQKVDLCCLLLMALVPLRLCSCPSVEAEPVGRGFDWLELRSIMECPRMRKIQAPRNFGSLWFISKDVSTNDRSYTYTV